MTEKIWASEPTKCVHCGLFSGYISAGIYEYNHTAECAFGAPPVKKPDTEPTEMLRDAGINTSTPAETLASDFALMIEAASPTDRS
jgi:hypothetical protein